MRGGYAGPLSAPARDSARIESLSLRGNEREPGRTRPKRYPQRSVVAVVAKGKCGPAAKGVEVVAPSLGHELGDAVAWPQALHVVFVTVHDDARVPTERVPKGGDVGLVAVHQARAEAGAMPEGETTGPGPPELTAKPAKLARVLAMAALRVEAE